MVAARPRQNVTMAMDTSCRRRLPVPFARVLSGHQRPGVEMLVASIMLLLPMLAASRVGDGWGTNIHWTSETEPGEAAMISKAFKVSSSS